MEFSLIAIQTLKNSQKRRKKMYQSKRKVVNVNNISKPEVLWCRILPTTIPVNLWHSVPKKNHNSYKVHHSTFADFCRFKLHKAKVPSSSTSLTVYNLCTMSTLDSIHPLTECHILSPVSGISEGSFLSIYFALHLEVFEDSNISLTSDKTIRKQR